MTGTGGSGRPDAPARGGPIGQVVSGFRLVCQGFGTLRRERSLWALSCVPIGLASLGLVVVAMLLYQHAPEITGAIDGLWPRLEATAWYTWIWVGPGRLLFWLLGHVLFVLVAASGAALAILLANVAAAPFLDALAWRAERLATGRVVESSESGIGALLRDAGRSFAGEARRLIFFLTIWLSLFGVGLLIPGAHLITGPAMLVITILFLPLEFAGYSLDRRQVPFAARRSWVLERWPRMSGFGAAAFAACFVPGVNILMIPALVVAGTLLVVSDPPPVVGRSAVSAASR